MNDVKGWQNQNARLGWDDEKFPMDIASLNPARTHITHNYFNGGLDYDDTSIYPTDGGSMTGQVPHSWKLDSEIRPHIHWLQEGSNVPNWLLAYKIKDNGATDIRETDFTNHSLIALTTEVFTYTSGAIRQISKGTAIDMTGINISAPMHFSLFRDTTNASGLFAGADGFVGDALVYQFDFHWQRDSYGSWQEYIK